MRLPNALGRVYYVLLALALVIAACSPDVSIDPDWCYTFNFETNDYESVFVRGEWISDQGFVTEPTEDGVNILYFTYSHPITVQAYNVEITAARGIGVEGHINVNARALVFGHEPVYLGGTNFVSMSIPEDLDEDTVTLVGQAAGVSGQTMTFNIQASQPVRLVSVRLLGTGVNPFPLNECPKETATFTWAPTNIATLAPTSTDVGGETPDPNLTPTIGSCLLPGQPSPTPNSSPSPTPTNQPWTETFDFLVSDGDFFPVSGAVWAGSNWTSGSGWRSGGPYWDGGGNISALGIQFDFDNAVTITGFDVYFHVDFGSFSSGNGSVVLANVSGTTLATYSLGAVTPKTLTYNSLSVGNVRQFKFMVSGYPYGGLNQLRVSKIVLRGIGQSPTSPTPTPWPNCTLTPTITPSISPTPTYTPTPLTLTPTPSRTPTRTPFPVIPPTVAPTRTPNPTNTIGPPTATLHPSITPTGTVGAFEPPGGISGDGGNGGLRGLGNAISALGSNVWQRATGWVGNMTSTIGRFTNAWNSAAPTALPGMPMCKSDPLANELCAIWFILTFTVFSGTLGSLIVPTGITIVDIFFLFLFIRMVRAILHQAKQIRS